MSQDAWVIERLIMRAQLGEDGAEEDDLIKDARKVARRLARGDLEVVEQGVLMPKAATIPDGWSYDDVNEAGRFVGNFWGIRLKRGEPFLYQKGNVLLVRHFEFYTERDRGYYERLSRVPGQTILVVIGFYGKREGYFAFEDGEMGPVVFADAGEIADWIVSWLGRALASPQPDWDKAREGF